MVEIRKAAVLGAGVMGSGIAAHLANAGVDVVLLDVERATAAAGVARQLRSAASWTPPSPSGSSPARSTRICALLADADWIIEAVAERLDVKQPLYRRVDAVRAPGSIVSSNTSTFPLATPDGGAAGELRRGLPHHAFLQPAAHHAAAGAGRPARARGPGPWRPSATSPTAGSARAW